MRNVGALVLSAMLAGAAFAQTKDHSGHQSAPQKSEAQTHKGVGVVKSLDAEKGTVMLAHEPIASLRWPSMTMKFTARDKKMLDKLAPGKKVEFEFVVQGKDYILTRLKQAAPAR
jgi:Cu(I)/Ag(I) efflux system periplasmic protein CusF